MKKISLLSFAAAIAVSGSALASDFAGYIGGGYSFVPVVSGAKGRVTTAADFKTTAATSGSQKLSITSADYKTVTMDKKGNAAIAGFLGFGYYVLPEVLIAVEGNYDKISNARYLSTEPLKFTSGNGPLVKFSRMGASLVINNTICSTESLGLALKIGIGYQRVSISQTLSDAAMDVLAGDTDDTDDDSTISTHIGGAVFASNTIGTGNSLSAVVGDGSNANNISATLNGDTKYSTLYSAFQGTKNANTFGVLGGVEVFCSVIQDALDVFIAGTWNYTKPVQTIGDKLDITLTIPANGGSAINAAAILNKNTATFAAVSPAHQLLLNAGLRAKF